MARVDAKWNWQPAFARREAGRAALRAAAERVKDDAVRNTPIATGDLRNSAGVTMDEGRAIVYYSDWKAVIIHERQANYRVGEWKYLENAAIRAQGSLGGDVARGIRF